ncbi:NrfD/PsrC family molybdoenzyme membrane anchor subunit [Chloroflexota bacterium]
MYTKPQKEWGWSVAVYLYLAGMGAGSFIIGIIMDWLGYFPYPERAVILWGPILTAIGAPFLILDLGIKRRFWKAWMNPGTSWVARGFLILFSFMVVGFVVFLASILPFQWLENLSVLILVLEIISLILAFGVAVYTGILLQSTRFVSLWNTWFLPLLFLVSALSTGSMGVVLSVLGYGILAYPQEAHPQVIDIVIHTEQVLISVEVLVLVLYLFLKYKAQDQGESSVRFLLAGYLKIVFWAGIVALGFLFPVILEFLYSSFPDYPALLILAGIFLLAGGFFLRLGIIYAGVKELHPLQNMYELEYIQKVLKKTKSASDLKS